MTTTLQRLPTDIQYIIASFLGPFELVQYRKLSKDSVKIISTFLQRTKDTTVLESLVCPICITNWISTAEFTSHFFDIDSNLHYRETCNRISFVEDCGVSRHNQCHLFCEECEINCRKLYSLPDFKNKNDSYRLCIDYTNYPWLCVIMEKDEHLYWNQYSAIEFENEHGTYIEDDNEDYNEDDNDNDNDNEYTQYFYNIDNDNDDNDNEEDKDDDEEDDEEAEIYENGY
jgi:hypothetical protein